MELRFSSEDIAEIAKRYAYRQGDFDPSSVRSQVKQRGFLRKDDFLSLCNWKTQRSRSKCMANSPELVQEVSRISLAASAEEVRIGVLLILNGVQWATASVILHFCHDEPYPILDRRALWSLTCPEPTSITFDFWWRYTQVCREIAQSAGVDMRTLDRALWQYSFEEGPRLS